jgi:AAA+ ATPase superfamily predicted ATPase
MSKTDYLKKLKLDVFDMSKITPDVTCLFLGMRRSGKTTNIVDLLYHMKKKTKIGLVMSKTDKFNKDYARRIPKQLIFDTFLPDKVHNLMVRQEKVVRENLKPKEAFLILDDIMSEKHNWSKNKDIVEVITNGRHYRILFIIASQIALGLPPSFRTNIEYAFLSRFTSNKEIEKLYDNYASVFSSKKIFKQVFEQCTENNGTLVIHLGSTSMRLEDKVFYYKSCIRPDFKMCLKDLWVDNEDEEETNCKMIDLSY